MTHSELIQKWAPENFRSSSSFCQWNLHWWKNSWGARVPPRGHVWLIHGMGEYGGRYHELASFLTGWGFDVWAPDLPGHGKTQLEMEFAQPLPVEEARRALQAVWKAWRIEHAAESGAPWFLMGHSLGGLITLDWVLAGKSSIDDSLEFAQKAFVSSPPLAVRLALPLWKSLLAEVAGQWLPDIDVPTGFLPEYMSQDAAMKGLFRSDAQLRRTTTPRVFLSIKEAADRICSSPQNIEIPLCLAVGSEDPIVNPASVRQYYESLKTHKQYLEFPGYYHEIFNEIGRSRCYDALLTWLLSQN